MAELFLASVFGLIGGLIRAVIGLIKTYRIKKTKFKLSYFMFTIATAGIIGMLISLAFTTNYIINLVIGYAGIDLLENLAKIIKKKI